MTTTVRAAVVTLVMLIASPAFGQTDGPCSASEVPSAGPAGTTGSSITFDAKGVEFGPWLRAFMAQVRRNWYVAAPVIDGTVEVTFRVQRDGRITDAKMTRSSGTPRLDKSALDAIITSSPAQPLPNEYPCDSAFFTFDFLFEESAAAGSSNPPLDAVSPRPSRGGGVTPIIDDPRNVRDKSPAVDVFTIQGGTIYHREHCVSLVGHRKVKVADRSKPKAGVLTACKICLPDGLQPSASAVKRKQG